MIERMDLIKKPFILNKTTAIRFETSSRSGDDVLMVDSLSKCYPPNKLFQNVSFKIYRGEKVALLGPNGIGKTTLLKILLKQIPYQAGEIQLGHNVQIAYYEQEQQSLNESNTVLDEIWEQDIHMTQTKVRTLLGSFLFHGEDVFKKVSDLSGGEKSRLALLKLMLSNANFLLMDEPTNHLDMASKEVLEDALLRYDGTVLVVSHDRYFLNKITDKTLVLSSDGMEEYLGNYTYYEEKKRELEQSIKAEPEIQKTKTQIRQERKKEKEIMIRERKTKQEQVDIEKQITILEEEIHRLNQQMCTAEIYADPEKSKEIHEKSNALKKKLDRLYKSWETYLK